MIRFFKPTCACAGVKGMAVLTRLKIQVVKGATIVSKQGYSEIGQERD